MKLTLCLIVLCSYLELSAARNIPDKNDLENDVGVNAHPNWPGYGGLAGFAADADRTSHDSTRHEYGADENDEGIPAHVLKQLEEKYLETLNRVNRVTNHAPVVAPTYPHPIPADELNQMKGEYRADETDEGFQAETVVAPVFELPIPAHVLKQMEEKFGPKIVDAVIPVSVDENDEGFQSENHAMSDDYKSLEELYYEYPILRPYPAYFR